ncbi:MAG TPA: bifunctional phosphoglucose/phosphomannose isomerase [Actinomycetota bacterium]|nr:bifunctional phosphoglucose/phosphomannose isomerase [Actinomycetota bacterium]
MSAPPGASRRSVLDDRAALAGRDPGDMLGQVAGAGGQARVALRAAQAAPLIGPLPEVVVVAGMGGSGIAGDVLAALAFAESAVPVVTAKGDRLPGFVGPGTLLVAVSYSGNTAETLSAVIQGLAEGARLVAVTSGGALAEVAQARGAPLVTIEGGRMPRAALWSLVVPVCSAAEAVGVLPPLTNQLGAAADALDEEASALGPAVATEENPAKQAALRLLDRLPVVWGSGQLGAVAATRFRTQCNENAKVPVVSGALPEANHNDVMGLEGGLGPDRELVLLRDEPGEHERDGRRVQAVLTALKIADPVVRTAGTGPALARLARLTAFADFTSVYLGIARGVDPTPIRTLDEVKAALASETGAAR